MVVRDDEVFGVSGFEVGTGGSAGTTTDSVCLQSRLSLSYFLMAVSIDRSAAADIAAHLVCPDAVLRAGRALGTLETDHEHLRNVYS